VPAESFPPEAARVTALSSAVERVPTHCRPLPATSAPRLAACPHPPKRKARCMSYRGETDELGMNLDVYGDGD
jgi:hypothetical protein